MRRQRADSVTLNEACGAGCATLLVETALVTGCSAHVHWEAVQHWSFRAGCSGQELLANHCEQTASDNRSAANHCEQTALGYSLSSYGSHRVLRCFRSGSTTSSSRSSSDDTSLAGDGGGGGGGVASDPPAQRRSWALAKCKKHMGPMTE